MAKEHKQLSKIIYFFFSYLLNYLTIQIRFIIFLHIIDCYTIFSANFIYIYNKKVIWIKTLATVNLRKHFSKYFISFFY